MLQGLIKKKNSASLGKRGENAAISYLKKQGYSILETNYCNSGGRRLGEIDIIAQQGQELVFVEVKTRTISFSNSPIPEESIQRNKLYKLNKIANHYIKINGLWNKPFRFDAIAILANPSKNEAQLRHIKNIFI